MKENSYTRQLLRDQAEGENYLKVGKANSKPQDNIVTSSEVRPHDGNLHTSPDRYYDGMESALARVIS